VVESTMDIQAGCASRSSRRARICCAMVQEFAEALMVAEEDAHAAPLR
jgi:hypothetical protein